MVVVSGNTGSAPLIGSKVIRDRASDGSVWNEKGSRIQGPTPNQTQTASGSRWTESPMGVKKRIYSIIHQVHRVIKSHSIQRILRLFRLNPLSVFYF